MSFTRDTISFDVLRTFRDCAEELGNEEHAWYGNRSLDQWLSYRMLCADGADTDALDHVCKLLNTEPPRVESFPGRRDWKTAVMESI